VNYFYWDASALVKRYAPEIGTPLINHLFAHVVLDRMMCLVIGTGEVVSIFVRKENTKLITDAAFAQALVDFRAEVIDTVAFKLVSVELKQLFHRILRLESALTPGRIRNVLGSWGKGPSPLIVEAM
jgi:predicted nucleic acid-binding protein